MSDLLPRSPAARPSSRTVFAMASALLAAWLAANSLGVVGPTLRATLLWSSLGASVLAAWPFATRGRAGLLFLLVGLAGVGGFVDAEPVFLVAGVLAVLALGAQDGNRQLYEVTALAVLGFALFRFALGSSALVWMLADTVGGALGRGLESVTGTALEIGGSFAGLDFLVLTGLLAACWLVRVERPRIAGWWAASAIVLGHTLYLAALALTPVLLERLPPATLPEFGSPYVPPPFQWSDQVRQWLPWNLPVLAAAIHIAIAVGLARWASWKPVPESSPGNRWASWGNLSAVQRAWLVAPLLLALLLPLLATLVLGRANLQGKTIVAYEAGNMDWYLPEHGTYGRASAGTYGMLPVLIQSLGGQFYLSPELAALDLEDVDVLLLLNPDQRLSDAMQARVWDFVASGGSLLVVTDGYLPQPGIEDTTNRLLQPVAVRVNQDAAVSVTGNWQAVDEWMAHPVAASLTSRSMPILSDTGASLSCRWNVKPLVIGRWGWSVPQQGAAWDAEQHFASGQRLGDLVLAAEQRHGRGRVLVLGDRASWTNEGLTSGWQLVGGVLTYLASRPSSPLALGRQVLVLAAVLGLMVLLARRVDPRALVLVLCLFFAAQAVCGFVNRRVMRIAPQGDWIAATEQQAGRGNRLAYVDASHLNLFSWQDWGFDALNGLCLTLMRNDFLPLMMPELSQQQLQQAGMFISIAPARSYSRQECRWLVDFVRGGGVLICMVGAEQAEASAALLAAFQMRVPASPVPTTGDWREPVPMGRFRAPYLAVEDPEKGEYSLDVLFYAGWPVEGSAGESQVLVSDAHGTPVILSRQVGRGTIMLIGDTCFAANKNLEYVGGEPFAGRYENAQFWRWLISRLTADETWIPPAPPPAAPPPADDPESPLPVEEQLPGPEGDV